MTPATAGVGFFFGPVREASGDKGAKQRVRPRRLRLELRVELDGHKPWMVRELQYLDQVTVRCGPRKDDPGPLEPGPVLVVELEPVPVPLGHHVRTVGGPGAGAGNQ